MEYRFIFNKTSSNTERLESMFKTFAVTLSSWLKATEVFKDINVDNVNSGVEELINSLEGLDNNCNYQVKVITSNSTPSLTVSKLLYQFNTVNNEDHFINVEERIKDINDQSNTELITSIKLKLL